MPAELIMETAGIRPRLEDQFWQTQLQEVRVELSELRDADDQSKGTLVLASFALIE